MKTPLTTTLLAGIVALIAAGCGTQSLAESVPLVEPQPIAVDGELLESAPYREGLPQEILPRELDGRRLDAEHVVRATTSCGLRTVWGRYGEAIVMLWRAPSGSHRRRPFSNRSLRSCSTGSPQTGRESPAAHARRLLPMVGPAALR